MSVAQLVDQAPPVDVLPARTGFKGAKVPWVHVHDDGIRPGLSTKVPDGAYRGTVRWSKPEAFLKGLRVALEAHPELRRTNLDRRTGKYKDVQGLERFMRIAEAVTLAADHRTGRDVRARRKEIAEAAGCSVQDVQRWNRIASRVLQILVPIADGRQLTLLERLDVWARQTSPRLKQHGVSTVWAFHVPPWLRQIMAAAAIQAPRMDARGRWHTTSDLQLKESAPHPRSGHAFETDHLAYNSPSHPTSGSLRSPSGPGSARTALMKKGRPPPGRQLAIRFVKAMPLLRSTSPKRLENRLKRFVESRPVWTAQDLLDAIQTSCERSGRSATPPADQIHTPWAFVGSLLDSIHEHDDHPRLPFVDPAELRCGRPECDYGWITLDDVAGRPLVRRCDRCRPGAWPEHESSADDLLDGAPADDSEPPF